MGATYASRQINYNSMQGTPHYAEEGRQRACHGNDSLQSEMEAISKKWSFLLALFMKPDQLLGNNKVGHLFLWLPLFLFPPCLAHSPRYHFSLPTDLGSQSSQSHPDLGPQGSYPWGTMPRLPSPVCTPYSSWSSLSGAHRKITCSDSHFLRAGSQKVSAQFLFSYIYL